MRQNLLMLLTQSGIANIVGIICISLEEGFAVSVDALQRARRGRCVVNVHIR